MMEKFRGVSDSELVLMRIIWDLGGVARYADIVEKLTAQDIDWPKNMINMLLQRLSGKGLIDIKKAGRKNEYTALVAREEYNAAEAQQLVERLYGGDVKGLVNTLGQMIPDEDREVLRRFWEGGEKDE